MTTPRSIIIGFSIFAVVSPIILIIGATKIDQQVWTVVAAAGTVGAAVGTVGAVIWAIFGQGILTRINKPVLQLNEIVPVIRVPFGFNYQSVDPKTGKEKTEKMRATRHVLYFELINTGGTIAGDARPFITAVASLKDGKWKLYDHWKDVSLVWAHDYYKTRITRLPSEDKNLIPERPYLFEFGWFGEEIPDYIINQLPEGWPVETFRISWSTILPFQPQDYGEGEHCFEITAYAIGAKAKKIYVKLDWKGGAVPTKENHKISVQEKRPKFWPNT